MSTSAGSPGSPYRTRSSAADAYLSRHQGRGPVHTCRCTLTVQAPAGKRIDVVALQAALQAVALPDDLRVTGADVYPGWQEEATD